MRSPGVIRASHVSAAAIPIITFRAGDGGSCHTLRAFFQKFERAGGSRREKPRCWQIGA